uniref:Ig-like domain-containing protein n=1 Tax=Xiphophorus couchianus TaxID=32473 RepID=A0A3B5KNC0_9TELE
MDLYLYSLISVTTGQLGEPVTFTCSLSDSDYSNTRVKWYKQTNGDTLRLITTLMKATTHPLFEKGFSPSRFAANYTTFKSTLTILKTFKEDEALYHCAVSTWNTDEWSGTYLPLNYSVVQWPTVSAPLQPGDSVTLQCSVLPHSQTGSCPNERRVSWFGVRKDTFRGSIIYTDQNASYNCDKKPDTSSDSKRCVYHFSKNVNSDDSGTYYCALAMCGEIIFGNGTKLEIEVKVFMGYIFMCKTATGGQIMHVVSKLYTHKSCSKTFHAVWDDLLSQLSTHTLVVILSSSSRLLSSLWRN